MNGAETRAALKQIAETKSMEFESQLLHLEKTSKTERKALSMSRQIALALANIANVDFKERGYEIKQQRPRGRLHGHVSAAHLGDPCRQERLHHDKE